MVKYDSREEITERNKSNLHTSSRYTQSQADDESDDNQSSSSSDGGLDLESFLNSSDAGRSQMTEEQLMEQAVNMAYGTNQRDEMEINYDHYQFSVAQKFDYATRNLTYKKYRYIADEVLLDLKWRQRHTITFKTTVLIILFLFELRILNHYIGQYLFLALVGVPVTTYSQYWHRVDLVYAGWAFWQDALVVCVGALANTFVFMFWVLLEKCLSRFKIKYPGFWYKILCWQGIYAVIDPPLTLFFDLVSRNWNGDHFKFYNYFDKLEGSGITGIYLVVFMVGTIMMFSGYVFYRYMIFVYMEGRILDLYRRLSGNQKTFFVPHDQEVSLKYLQWVLERYRRKDCIVMSEMRTLRDKYGNERNINFIQLFHLDGGFIHKNRLFFKDFDGSIQEVPQRKVILTAPELRKLKKEYQEGSAHLYGTKYRSLNGLVKQTF